MTSSSNLLLRSSLTWKLVEAIGAPKLLGSVFYIILFDIAPEGQADMFESNYPEAVKETNW
jgi:hypothetical protein